MLKVRNLTYEYPDNVALSDVSFEIKKGAIVGLIGHNGAGKTTLMRCIVGIEIPLSGSIHINNIDVIEHPREAHKVIGYLPDFFGVYSDLKVWQCLHYMALANQVPKDKIAERVREIIDELHLNEMIYKNAGSLSRGQRQRLAIGQAIIHEPALLVLDEPASGLDPEARYELGNLLVKLKNRGMTIIVSSHILTELDQYCTEVIILNNGKLVKHQKILDLSENTKNNIKVTFAKDIDNSTRTALQKMVKDFIELDTRTIRFEFTGNANEQSILLSKLIYGGLKISSFSTEKVSLQTEYLKSLNVNNVQKS